MLWTVTQTLLDGLLTTFHIFIMTLIFSLPLGLLIALGSISRFRILRLVINLIV